MLAVVSALAAATAASASEIYRTTDEDGNVYYTDKPAGERSERLDIESKATREEDAEAELQAVLDRRNAAEEKKVEQAKERENRDEMLAEQKEREEACSMYRERLTRYLQAGRMYKLQENGERVYLEPEQIEKTRADTEQKIKEYCNN